MAIYENISMIEMAMKRPLRVFSNAWNVFVSGPKTGKPFKIKFESSTICNLKCVMCPLTKGLKRKTGILKFENFKKVFDEIRIPYVNLTGLGEPLLNPEIFKIIKYTREKGSLVKLDTNATLLNEKMIKNLVSSDPTIISVSIDGITKKSYEKIRKGANFEEVIENLKRLVEYRNKVKSKSKIHLFFVFQRDNMRDLSELTRFGEKIGVDVINGTIAVSFGRAKNEKLREISPEEIEKIKKKLSELRKHIKIKLNIEGIDDFLKSPEDKLERMRNKPCFKPWYSPCITWDGYVVPCDIHCDNEVVFGNAFDEPFMRIWNNKKAQEFRKNILKQRTGVCWNCFGDESFILDKMKFLYKIPVLNKIPKRKI